MINPIRENNSYINPKVDSNKTGLKTNNSTGLIADPVDVAHIDSPKKTAPSSPEKNVEKDPPLNKFTPLIDDDVFTADVMKEVANAKDSIVFETYLLNGKDGKALCDLLIKRKNEGIEVKVMLDSAMQKLESWLHKDDPLYQMGKYLKEKGVDYVPYPLKKLKGSLTPSEHAKILVIDDKISYIGGSNIDDTYNHDINVKIEGPAAKDMKGLFDESWNVAADPDPAMVGFSFDPLMSNSNKIKMTSTSPARSTVKPAVLKNIREAKESILIEMFTLTDDEIEKELLSAKKRGVDVKIILCDNKEIFHVPTFHMPNISAAVKFKKAGIPVKWYVNDKFTQMHSKLCVFDHKKVMIGSANFIHNAFRGIHEYYGEINDKDLAAKMEAQFDKDWNDHAVDVEKPGIRDRILAGGVELIDDIIF
ncbi:MAG: phosphatidylserine/phosphatidylglycerophosphate/cardiolipin synthase family protein [Candidatus Eremiobacteraeota bacterium]|nr:phosphatidylserine/phosphatidylglycerophosphate/cardiolipin synthase family protein [Candidatus Eremiobacteraeota bacterium]